MEITRVTLENFLKKWDGAPLLNKISNTEVEHKKGSGVKFKVEAPHANILMNTQGGMFINGDAQIMDTFYTNEIISLQQERLVACIKKFISDFYTYMPQLSSDENFEIVFEVKDAKVKRDGKVMPPTPKADTRQYQLTARWKMTDLKDLKDGKLNASQFTERITIEKE